MGNLLKRLLPVAILVISLAQSGQSWANLIVNGSFEEPNIATNSFSILTNISGWATTFGPGIEIQDNVAGAPFLGAQHVELDSTGNRGMAQSVATSLGTTYHLSFAYSARPGISAADNGIQVFFNGGLLANLAANGVGLQNTDWQVFNFDVSGAAGTSVLEFRATGASNSLGGYLDDVRLEKVSEPHAFFLLGVGLLALVRRFRRLNIL